MDYFAGLDVSSSRQRPASSTLMATSLWRKIEAEPTAIVAVLEAGRPLKAGWTCDGSDLVLAVQRVALRRLSGNLPRVPPCEGGAERHEEQNRSQ